MKRNVLVLAVVLAISLVGVAQAAYSADITDDFSLAANPNGDWSYGWYDPDNAGAFTLYNGVNAADAGSGTQLFSAHVKDGDWDTWGNIGWNLGPDVIDGPWGSYREVGKVMGGPSVAGLTNAARWTAPAAGTYQIDGIFTGLSLGGSHYTASVLNNGGSEWSAVVEGFIGGGSTTPTNGPSPSQTYSGLLTLAAGDTIDFTVTALTSPGPFGLDIQIAEVPEPMTLVLLGMGGLSLIRRRRA